MSKKIRQKLVTLYQNAKEELSTKPVQSSGILVGMFVIVLPLLSLKYVRGFVWHLLKEILQPSIELSIFPLIISSLVLLLVPIVISFKNNKLKNKTYYFIPYNKFTWKINLSNTGFPTVDPTPYCKKHQIKLVDVAEVGFFCSYCGGDSAIKLSTQLQIDLKNIVQNLAEANQNEHIKND